MKTTFSCSDRTCGASDCLTCHPENFPDGKLLECPKCGSHDVEQLSTVIYGTYTSFDECQTCNHKFNLQ